MACISTAGINIIRSIAAFKTYWEYTKTYPNHQKPLRWSNIISEVYQSVNFWSSAINNHSNLHYSLVIIYAILTDRNHGLKLKGDPQRFANETGVLKLCCRSWWPLFVYRNREVYIGLLETIVEGYLWVFTLHSKVQESSR